VKLFKLLNAKKLTLYKTFRAYDEGRKGRLELKEFEKILNKLDPSFTLNQVKAVFELVDKDQSQSVEFD
jgi:Ca2+-binding EF-hand superfamily protein